MQQQEVLLVAREVIPHFLVEVVMPVVMQVPLVMVYMAAVAVAVDIAAVLVVAAVELLLFTNILKR